ncbi:MAG: MBOAT family O-acyltransferase, partial [Candidatus Cryptobacteroides sp.]
EFIAGMEHPYLTMTSAERAGAIRRIVFGTVKFCILSRITGHFLVDPVFAAPATASGPACLLAVYAYTFQLYCDFSGYTDLAIGISRFIGIPLPENFALPYHSASITEFWRRWHISLSSWLKDYLYISLGGNRKGRLRTYANLLITMVLGGLWHGVGVMFLLWGAWHGILLCVHKFLIAADNRFCRYWFAKTGSGMKPFPRAAGIFLTFNAVAFGWLMFRSPDWGTFATIAGNIFSGWSHTDFQSITAMTAAVSPDLSPMASLAVPLSALAFAVFTHFLPSSSLALIDRCLDRSGFLTQTLLLVLTIWLAMQTTSVLFPGAASALPVYANF